MKYISNGTWFDERTVCELINDYENGSGLFCGIRTCKNPLSEGRNKKIGEKYKDEEICSFKEFTVIE